MSKEKILQAALVRFAQQGYDNTSLSQIAEDVDIRKPSLYAHFHSKQHIFITLHKEAYQREKDFILSLHNSGMNAIKNLKTYLLAIPERYEKDPYFLFWLRTLYFPPLNAGEDIRFYDREYSQLIDDSLDEILKSRLDGIQCRLAPAAAKNMLICILRGLHSELLYRGIDEIMPRIDAACQTIDLIFKSARQ